MRADETDDIDSIEEDRKDEHEHELRSRDDIPETEKSQLILARRGQGQFRTRVQLIERKCRVTGLSLLEHLTPSHIKPWKLSNRCEKLDGNNGLMLSPHADRLFDRGYISFKKNGSLLVSPQIKGTDIWEAWHIDPDMNVGNFSAKQAVYLKFHRENKFDRLNRFKRSSIS